MRDLILLAVLPFLIFAIFQRPFIGLGLWIWTALFYPNGWVYGAASNIRYNLLFTGITIAVYFTSKHKVRLVLGATGTLLLMFFFWVSMSTIFGLAPAEYRWELWTRFAKIIALFIFILLIVEKKLHIDFFLWCLIFSVGFYAGLEGLKYILSGGGHKIEGMAGHVLGDRNELSIAMAMLLPICFYLMGEFGNESKLLKIAFLGLISLLVIAIIGTHSRGGLVALIAVGTYLFIKSKRKLLFLILLVCAGSAFLGFIPKEWFERMNTIGQASGDASFMGRVVAWKLSFILAVQNPLFGGGFKALEYQPVWANLVQDFYRYSFFYTGDNIPPIVPRAAHSIYFQVLGDHGFIGLFLFCSTLLSAFMRAGKIARICIAKNGPEWIKKLATMLRLSIFTYAVGGAALSFSYFDMIYALIGLVIVLDYRFLMPFILQKQANDSPQFSHVKNEHE